MTTNYDPYHHPPTKESPLLVFSSLCRGSWTSQGLFQEIAGSLEINNQSTPRAYAEKNAYARKQTLQETFYLEN